MAVSDYDSVMVDGFGNPQRWFLSPCKVRVEIYKTVVDIVDRKARRQLTGWKNGLVSRVMECQLNYQDVSLVARRGPQGGVYVAVWVGTWVILPVGAIGYGVPAHNDRGQRVGISNRSLRWFAKSLRDEKLFPGVPDFLLTKFCAESLAELAVRRSNLPRGDEDELQTRPSKRKLPEVLPGERQSGSGTRR
jgi:hypothetical protein